MATHGKNFPADTVGGDHTQLQGGPLDYGSHFSDEGYGMMVARLAVDLLLPIC